jgi:membrane associated rhomboid family serine protease
MSLYQIRFERPPWAAWFALVKAESLLAGRPHRVIDALFVFALVILPMVAFIALLFLLSSADPTTAVAGAVDGTGMAILPP